jgi:hypothetical protein
MIGSKVDVGVAFLLSHSVEVLLDEFNGSLGRRVILGGYQA